MQQRVLPATACICVCICIRLSFAELRRCFGVVDCQIVQMMKMWLSLDKSPRGSIQLTSASLVSHHDWHPSTTWTPSFVPRFMGILTFLPPSGRHSLKETIHTSIQTSMRTGVWLKFCPGDHS